MSDTFQMLICVSYIFHTSFNKIGENNFGRQNKTVVLRKLQYLSGFERGKHDEVEFYFVHEGN